jgi:hypothetical protein
MLVLQSLIFQRNERIAIAIAVAFRQEHQKKADAAYVQEAASQLFSHMIIDHGLLQPPSRVEEDHLISWDNIYFSEGPSEYLISLIRHPFGVFVNL